MEHTDRYSNKTVLVTGASGFIGEHLSRKLVSEGADVHGTYRQAPASIAGLHWHRVDLADDLSAGSTVQSINPDIIFHLASHVVGNRHADAVLPTLHCNFMSTVYLLHAALGTDCRRIVLASSLEEPEHGDQPAVPSSPYAASKFAASTYARMFHALYQSPVVIARVFMVYGPGQKDLNKLVPYTILRLLKREAPSFSSGTRQVDWIYIDDVVKGLLALGVAAAIEGDTIDLGSGLSYSIRDVVETIFELTEQSASPEFGGLSDRVLEQERIANVDETYRKTGWRADCSLTDGCLRTIAWYRAALESGKLP